MIGAQGRELPLPVICCDTEDVERQQRRTSRAIEVVLSRAALIGLASAIPISLLSLMTLGFIQALGEGAAPRAALANALPGGEDWEILPFFLLGAVVVGAVVASLASLAWWWIATRWTHRRWLAMLAAVVVAAVLPAVAFIDATRWPLALSTATLAGLAALLAAPHVCYEPSGTSG